MTGHIINQSSGQYFLSYHWPHCTDLHEHVYPISIFTYNYSMELECQDLENRNTRNDKTTFWSNFKSIKEPLNKINELELAGHQTFPGCIFCVFGIKLHHRGIPRQIKRSIEIGEVKLLKMKHHKEKTIFYFI